MNRTNSKACGLCDAHINPDILIKTRAGHLQPSLKQNTRNDFIILLPLRQINDDTTLTMLVEFCPNFVTKIESLYHCCYIDVPFLLSFNNNLVI